MASMTKWVSVFSKELATFMKTAPAISPIHKTDHIQRVWKTSEVLCKKLGGDLEIMVATVFLHDLGRHHGLEIHGEKSAELARSILERLNFPKDKIEPALDAIAKHDYTTPNEARTSVYAKILYDADKLDAFGKVGIQRHITFYLNKGKTVKEILEMMEKRWEGLSIPESKEVGRKDYELTRRYFINLGKKQNRLNRLKPAKKTIRNKRR